MLLQFNITNVLSFKNEAILDLIPNNDESHEESLIHIDNNRVMPVAVVYGANASGKSNLFKAMTAAILFVRNSHHMQINTRIGLVPFLLDKTSRKEKTRVDFVFVRKGIKYEYGFVVDSTKVYEEYLYAYKSAKPSLIFERSDVNHYRYTGTRERVMRQYESLNADNMLFLATATAWNCQETKEPFLWFVESIDTYDKASVENAMVAYMDTDENGERKEHLLNALRVADFNISDYEFTSKQGDLSKVQLPPGMTFDESLLAQVKEWKLEYMHDVEINNSTERFSLPYEVESSGTLSFTAYALIMHDVLAKGKTMVVDELDSGLHPMLIRYLVEMFTDPDTNRNGAQLIFNTHAMTLLDLDIFRRDQILFVEKDNRTGESELFALSDFNPMPRKTDKVLKRYMQGRYGAIPEIAEEYK